MNLDEEESSSEEEDSDAEGNQIDRKTERQIDSQTDRKTDRQKDRQTDRPVHRLRETDRQRLILVNMEVLHLGEYDTLQSNFKLHIQLYDYVTSPLSADPQCYESYSLLYHLC